VLVLGVAGALRGAMLAGTVPVLSASAVALLGCALAYTTLLMLIMWWEARKCTRALPR
jgi:hypothetical protein